MGDELLRVCECVNDWFVSYVNSYIAVDGLFVCLIFSTAIVCSFHFNYEVMSNYK